jgi:hypothetical protein
MDYSSPSRQPRWQSTHGLAEGDRRRARPGRPAALRLDGLDSPANGAGRVQIAMIVLGADVEVTADDMEIPSVPSGTSG